MVFDVCLCHEDDLDGEAHLHVFSHISIFFAKLPSSHHHFLPINDIHSAVDGVRGVEAAAGEIIEFTIY